MRISSEIVGTGEDVTVGIIAVVDKGHDVVVGGRGCMTIKGVD